MLYKIANLLSKNLAAKLNDTEEKVEIYTYGLELIISTLCAWLSILFISLILNDVLSGVIFISFYSTLRFFVGGYHAKSYLKCFIVSNITYCIILLLEQNIVIINKNLLIAFLLLNSVFILRKNPLVNPNQPIGIELQKKNQRIARFVLVMEVIIILIGLRTFAKYSLMAILSIFLVTFFILVTDIQSFIRRERLN